MEWRFVNMKNYSEIKDGMQIEWNVPVEMDDGIILRADIFRPIEAGQYPVILSSGPYGKGLQYQEGYSDSWKLMIEKYPDTAAGTTNKYQNWETVDPEKWVPDGYVVIRFDCRGAGCSEGYLDVLSPREIQDIYQCIEWAAAQTWSNGKVGMNGISYYSICQWLVAGLQPPHLAALCIYEGSNDYYRDQTYHGGIVCDFLPNWYANQVQTIQHGRGERGHRNPVTGDLVCGDEMLSDEELKASRADPTQDIISRPLNDNYYQERSANFEKVTVPFLSAGNWGGQGLHLRGNVEGFVRAASKNKWLEIHGGEHWTCLYTDDAVKLQKRFLGHYLKGEDNGWDKQPPVQLQVRHVDKFVERHENEWPIARTQWNKLYFDPAANKLVNEPSGETAKLEFDALGAGLTFLSAPFEEETEITGPMAAKLFVSSSTADADLFLVFRLFTPDMLEVTFQGANDPRTPIAQGWLRASHRKLDPIQSSPYRPYHTHDEIQPLEPGVPVELDIEIWPTCIVVPAGYRVGLSIRGKDYEVAKKTGFKLTHFSNEMLGCGPLVHDDYRHQKAGIFSGHTTLHFDAKHISYILFPVIPAK
jgi:predicted acyl esterase